VGREKIMALRALKARLPEARHRTHYIKVDGAKAWSPAMTRCWKTASHWPLPILEARYL
jgi:hypothetical protein